MKRQVSSDGSSYDQASFLSRSFMLMVQPVMLRGFKRPLQSDDSLPLPSRLAPVVLGRAIAEAWSRQVAEAVSSGKNGAPKQPSFTRALWSVLGDYMVWAIGLQMLVVLVKMSSVLLVRRLIQIVEADDDALQNEGLFCVAGLFAQNLFEALLSPVATGQLQQALYGCLICSAQVVLKKGAVLHPAAQGKHKRGDLVMLALSDLARLIEMSGILMYGVGAPVMLLFSFVIMALLLGPMVLSAFLTCIGATFAILHVSRLQGRSFRSKMIAQGQRMSILNEMLQSIRFTKYYVLEEHYVAKLKQIRKSELDALWWMKFSLGFNWPIAALVPAGSAFMVFGLHILIHGDLPNKPDTFAILAAVRFMFLPFAFGGGFLGGVNMFNAAAGRVHTLLLQPEMHYAKLQDQPTVESKPEDSITATAGTTTAPVQHSALGVCITNQSFSWSLDGVTLDSITLKVPRGELWAIVGELGSGKTSLLNAIFGGIDRVGSPSGESWTPAYGPTRTYVSQEPMIMNASLRQNVIFSDKESFDNAALEATYSATALWPDLKVLPGGDQTEIGEKGITLSGGQKARVALARAVLATKPGGLVLLDDPLAAVDAHVGAHLFEECIVGALAKTTRILVTNQLHFLSHQEVAQVVVMSGGKIVEQGSWADLTADGASRFSKMVAAQEGADRQKRQAVVPALDDLDGLKKLGDTDKPVVSLTKAETKAQGAVSWSTFKFYINALGGCHVFISLVMCSWFFHWSELLPDLFLAMWQDDVFGWTRDQYLACWLATIVIGWLLCASSRMAWVRASWRAARQIHDGVLDHLVHCPTHFFDKTPSGRIMNRAGEDQMIVDLTCPLQLEVLCIGFFQAFDATVLAIVGRPLVAPFIAVFICVFLSVREVHRRTFRETMRWLMVTKSPVFTCFEEFLAGASTIFAFGCEEYYFARFEAALQTNVEWLMLKDRGLLWSEQRLRSIGAFVVATLGVQIVLLPDSVSPSISTISMIYALQLGFSIQTMSSFLVMVEGVFTSVERIMEFSRDLEQEPPFNLLGDADVRQGPWSGHQCTLEFDCVSVRYLPHMPLALDSLSMQLAAHEKIGIVGRTGSGKSTVMGALFRLTELEKGRIILSGVDITGVGIATLRRQITIVPQDPMLFSGDLRKNLDPVGTVADDEIWQALRRCGLDKLVEGLEGQLQGNVSDGGTNFSVGERQVLCLARALLRNPKVLCLDEATANVDPTNDQRIQKVLSQEVAKCLVLTIAHRLHTVMASDRIVVLDQGRLAQFDTPAALLSQPGIFQSLAMDAGIQPIQPDAYEASI